MCHCDPDTTASTLFENRTVRGSMVHVQVVAECDGCGEQTVVDGWFEDRPGCPPPCDPRDRLVGADEPDPCPLDTPGEPL